MSTSERRRALLILIAKTIGELANLEWEAAPIVYTSSLLPPDVLSRTLFARACRSIPEARRQGKTWIVPRAAWERARRPRRAERNRDRDDLRDSLGLARRAA